jgi:hypothetical protein
MLVAYAQYTQKFLLKGTKATWIPHVEIQTRFIHNAQLLDTKQNGKYVILNFPLLATVNKDWKK